MVVARKQSFYFTSPSGAAFKKCRPAGAYAYMCTLQTVTIVSALRAFIFRLRKNVMHP